MGTYPSLHSSLFPLNYGTIPQAEKQEKETSFCLDGASFSVSLSGLGGGAGEGAGVSEGAPAHGLSYRTRGEVDFLPTPFTHP